MTSFQVLWSREGIRQLAILGTAASYRFEITNAPFRIDQALSADPKLAGRELSEGLWRIAALPLIVFYEINDIHKAGRVTDVFNQ